MTLPELCGLRIQIPRIEKRNRDLSNDERAKLFIYTQPCYHVTTYEFISRALRLSHCISALHFEIPGPAFDSGNSFGRRKASFVLASCWYGQGRDFFCMDRVPHAAYSCP